MFGFPQEQFHKFIASSTTTATSRTMSNINNPPPPPPLSFPSPFPITFDAYPSSSSSHDHLHLQQMHEQQPTAVLLLNKHDDKDNNEDAAGDKEQIKLDGREEIVMDHPWSNNEVLSLLRIRSSMDNWFPDLTWKHVSRKLGEFGFKRSAEKCKEKFEEETRNFNSICFNKTRFESELEELMFHEDKTQKNNDNDHQQEDVAINNPSLQVEISPEKVKKSTASSSSSKQLHKIIKRKREKKFEEFCIDIVNKMMAQQEEMHNKLLRNILSKDDEKIAREEARRRQEMENFIKETEIRRHEQAIAGERQATFIEILNKFTRFQKIENSDLVKLSNTMSSPYHLRPQNIELITNNSSAESNPSSVSNLLHKSKRDNKAILPSPFKTCNQIDDIGRRWPKDEVLALINVRCKLHTTNVNNNNEESATGSKVGSSSLWERISQGMMEFGYKRSAKRCKEKWENINKYFRKTKDNENKKKRCVDSRTCPYFQELSSLYDQGTLVAPAERN